MAVGWEGLLLDRFFTYMLGQPGAFLKFFILLFIYLFIGCVGSSLMRAAFSSSGERGLLFVVVRGLLIEVASLAVEHGL